MAANGLSLVLWQAAKPSSLRISPSSSTQSTRLRLFLVLRPCSRYSIMRGSVTSFLPSLISSLLYCRSRSCVSQGSATLLCNNRRVLCHDISRT